MIGQMIFGVLPLLVGLALAIYFTVLAGRFVRAVERIADRVEPRA